MAIKKKEAKKSGRKKVSAKVKKLGDFKEEKEKTGQGKNRELYWILGSMTGLILIFIVGSAVFEGLNKFEHEEISFTKEKFGEIEVYRHTYFYTHPLTDELIKYNMYLRLDPRKNNVPVEGKSTKFTPGKFAYVSIGGTGEFNQCEMSSVAIASISAFLVNNGIEIKGATTDPVVAEENNITLATCESRPDRIVIEIDTGEETKIVRDGNCQQIFVSNCEILQAVEKYEVTTLIDSRL